MNTGILVVAGLLLFCIAFILLATWLGHQDRTVYSLKPRPALGIRESDVCSRLGTWLPRFPEQDPEWPSDEEPPVTTNRTVDSGALTKRYEDLARRYPQDAHFQGALGWARLLGGRADRAVPVLEKAVDTERPWGGWQLMLGLAQRSLGQTDEARAALLEAELLLEEDPDVAYQLALASRADGETRVALMWAQRAVGRARRWPDAQLLFGQLCLEMRDHARARRAFLDVLQLRPEDPHATEALRRTGDTDR